MELTADQKRRQQKIVTALGKIDYALPGSVEVRRTRCGKSTCRCQSDPEARHGPYIVWTRKVKARTVTKVLSEEELRDYQQWLHNSRKLRELVDELHRLSLQIVERDQTLRRDRRRGRSAKGAEPPQAPTRSHA